MPKKRIFKDLSTKTVSVDMVSITGEVTDRLKEKFNFNNDFNMSALINDINSWYKLILQLPKDTTAKQTAERLSDLHDQIKALISTIGKLSYEEKFLLIRTSEKAEVKFLPSETEEYLKQLACHAFMAIPEVHNNNGGRPKKIESKIVISKLYWAYKQGTGNQPTCSDSNPRSSKRHSSLFIDFCEEIIGLLGMGITNSTIGRVTRKLIQEDKL